MSIQNDRWITEMALQHGMIEPFEPSQVRDVVTITVSKSTYARCGIITNVTPFEPEWEGCVTLEISNTTPLPARFYANEGIAQVPLFPGGGAAPGLVPGQEGQVPGADGGDAAAALSPAGGRPPGIGPGRPQGRHQVAGSEPPESRDTPQIL
jgi:hypothetical protein